MWLWLRYKLAAVALIQPLAWEPPYATGSVLKSKKKKKKIQVKDFLLWHNRIGNVSGALGHRFNPQPDTVC